MKQHETNKEHNLVLKLWGTTSRSSHFCTLLPQDNTNSRIYERMIMNFRIMKKWRG